MVRGCKAPPTDNSMSFDTTGLININKRRDSFASR